MNTIVKAVTVVILTLTTTLFAQQKDVKTSESSVKWIGKKLTGSHSGTLNLSKGFITFENDEITGGEFVVDMTTLTVTDIEETDSRKKLEEHLNSDDFFGTSKHKTAKLIIKSAEKTDEEYHIMADLTIKGKTNPVHFTLTVEDDLAYATLNIDRTKYDIKYGSGSFFDNLGDKAIDNEFELDVTIKI